MDCVECDTEIDEQSIEPIDFPSYQIRLPCYKCHSCGHVYMSSDQMLYASYQNALVELYTNFIESGKFM